MVFEFEFEFEKIKIYLYNEYLCFWATESVVEDLQWIQ